jgi:hypothetical protein
MVWDGGSANSQPRGSFRVCRAPVSLVDARTATAPTSYLGAVYLKARFDRADQSNDTASKVADVRDGIHGCDLQLEKLAVAPQ